MGPLDGGEQVCCFDLPLRLARAGDGEDGGEGCGSFSWLGKKLCGPVSPHNVGVAGEDGRPFSGLMAQDYRRGGGLETMQYKSRCVDQRSIIGMPFCSSAFPTDIIDALGFMRPLSDKIQWALCLCIASWSLPGKPRE